MCPRKLFIHAWRPKGKSEKFQKKTKLKCFKIIFQTKQEKEKNSRICNVVSESFQQKTHIHGPYKPIFTWLSQERIFLDNINQLKLWTFFGIGNFQMDYVHQQSDKLQEEKAIVAYASFIEIIHVLVFHDYFNTFGSHDKKYLLYSVPKCNTSIPLLPP